MEVPPLETSTVAGASGLKPDVSCVRAFHHGDPSRASRLEQHGVQPVAGEADRVTARGCPIEPGGELPARWRMDAHFGQPMSASGHRIVQQAQLFQHGYPTGIDVLGTRLMPGEAGLVQEQNRMSGAGQQERGGTPGRAATDDDDLCIGLPS